MSDPDSISNQPIFYMIACPPRSCVLEMLSVRLLDSLFAYSGDQVAGPRVFSVLAYIAATELRPP